MNNTIFLSFLPRHKDLKKLQFVILRISKILFKVNHRNNNVFIFN